MPRATALNPSVRGENASQSRQTTSMMDIVRLYRERCAWWMTAMLHAVKQQLDGVCGVSQDVCVGLAMSLGLLLLLLAAWRWRTVFPLAPPPPLAPHPPPPVPWAVTPEMGFWERMHGDPARWPVAIEITGHADTIIRYWDEFKLRVILPNAPVHVFAQVYVERDTEANARLYDMIKHEEFIKSVKTEYWPLNTSLVQGIIRPHQKVWDELHLGKKRVGLGDLPRGKLPKPAHSLLVQWRQRFLATQLREQFAIQEHVVYRGVLVLDAALGLGAPIHLRHYDKDAIYIPRCCDNTLEAVQDHFAYGPPKRMSVYTSMHKEMDSLLREGVEYNSKKLLWALMQRYRIPLRRFDMPTAQAALCCKFPCVATGYWQREESDLKSLAVDDATCPDDSCRPTTTRSRWGVLNVKPCIQYTVPPKPKHGRAMGWVTAALRSRPRRHSGEDMITTVDAMVDAPPPPSPQGIVSQRMESPTATPPPISTPPASLLLDRMLSAFETSEQ